MKALTLLLIFFSYNIYTQTWIEQVSGVSVSLNSVVTSSWGQAVWTCGNNGTVLRTSNDGTNWINVSGNGIPSDVHLNTIAFLANDPAGALTAGLRLDTAIVYRTTNNGANWQVVLRQYNGKINGIFTNFIMGFMIGNPVGGRWSIWKSTNNGMSWDSSGLYVSRANTETGWNNSFSYKLPYIFFGTNNSRLYYSTNDGTSWSFRTFTGEANITAIDITSGTIDNYNGYIAGANKILFTSNTGSNWAEETSMPGSGNIVGMYKQSLPVDAFGYYNLFITRGDNKILYQAAYNSNWQTGYTAPSGNYTHISNTIPGRVFAVRNNGGISYCGCNISGISNSHGSIPEVFSLHQNYPNPFNPVTNIKFDLPKSSFVKMTIYDLLGREIATLVNQQMQAGSYSADWDASAYPSGIYFYKIEAEDFTETRKMVLVK